MKRLVCSLFFALAAAPAPAIDWGTAQGSLQADAKRTYKLTNAYAFHDRKEMRVVISDREVPKNLLPDLNFLAVSQAVREGRFHGLFLQVNTVNQKQSVVTVLHPSVFSRTAGTLATLSIGGNRVNGEVDSGGSGEVQYRAKFSAPIFTPVAKR